MFHLHNLLTAYSLAKIQEENLAITKKPHKGSLAFSPDLGILKNPTRYTEPPTKPTKPFESSKIPLPIIKINQTKMKEIRDNDIYY